MRWFWSIKKADRFSVAFDLKRIVPELAKTPYEELSDYLVKSKFSFYEEKKSKVSFLMRLTLPLAMVLMVTMIILMPLNYIVFGTWGFSSKFIMNWFRQLGL